ncbi:aldehyde dehydrogenase family protein [Alicycliphilus denitrificans]|uniref:4-(hydroxymethyl)benzenesulfonate dehydrogenase n=1 Tax=Alicycliphilus denitrificans TaxID=179636 RepID=A0A420K915_9BURK|nr:aldehyde dehydrogenase family protein [Alicycliphilus denitrificans]RKJ95131.1 aldehyde dehydrogenase [Alicycliphilus denitrificans]
MTFSVLPIRDRFNVKPGRLFIDGAWQDGGESRFDQIHPATNEVVTHLAEAGASGVNAAVAAARRAFDKGPWRKMAARERKRLLQPIVDRIYAAEEEIAYLQTLDNGMPISFSRGGRVSAKVAADMFDHYAGWIDKITGETFPHYTDANDIHYMTFRDPVGVVAAITPWNGPVMTFAMKVAPALACGNTVVLKPSELASLAALKLADIIAEADLPPGVFNIVTGGPVTGEALSTHPDVDKVSFTGSPVVGEKIYSTGGRNMKRLSLELGGKSAALVFPDTRDVRTAARNLMGLCSTFLSGQICSTPTRAVVHRSILDEFVHHAQEQVKEVRFGDPFDPATTSAPIISKRQVERVCGYIESGKEQGARLVFGGDRPGGDLARGNWINPTLFVDVDNKMRIAREEIFGPVLSVIAFDTEEEAVAIANDSEYGLSGGIYTTDLSRAFRVAREMRTGTVGVNGYSAMPNSPAGGIKRSGLGREGGWTTVEEFTELKTVMLNLAA